MDEREKYARRVFETALFFLEMWEENNDGQTTAIQLLKPNSFVKNTSLRKFVLHDLYKKRGLNLTEAAVQLALWQPEGSAPPAFAFGEIELQLRSLCHSHEQVRQEITCEKAKKRRAFLRAARYIKRIDAEGAPAHSRVVEAFIPESFVPKGRGLKGQGHREHVVPCVCLRDESRSRFINKGATIEQVADFLERHVVIIEIHPEEQKDLDGSKQNGYKGLKNKMPDGWSFDKGCIFDRLHEANIAFAPPIGFAPCNH